MDEWVVRAGIPDPARLIAGYGRHQGYPTQPLYGFSVQHHPGSSVEELARAGRFPNGQISYAQRTDLEAALRSLSYSCELRRTIGTGFHHTFVVLYDVTNTMVTVLPQIVAEALCQTFRRRRNPFPVTPRRRP